jgi:hypothetical protein
MARQSRLSPLGASGIRRIICTRANPARKPQIKNLNLRCGVTGTRAFLAHRQCDKIVSVSAVSICSVKRV